MSGGRAMGAEGRLFYNYDVLWYHEERKCVCGKGGGYRGFPLDSSRGNVEKENPNRSYGVNHKVSKFTDLRP